MEITIDEMNGAWISVAPLFAALCLFSVLKSNRATLLPNPSSSSSSSSSTLFNDSDDVRTHHRQKKPNIVVIIADDLGWNDVSFHGSDQIPTPNIDALAYNGVILNSHYVPALCTPSRAALMTGKYPTRLGMQHSVILHTEPRGLPLDEKLLPEYLKEAGYATHAVGKWHLGFYKNAYTPTYRGFDSFFGYYNGLQDYYTHYSQDLTEKYNDYFGFDMRRNLSVAWDTYNKYSTDLFTEEAVRLINSHDTKDPMFLYLAHLAPHSGNPDNLLQAPDEEIAKFGYIHDPERRTFAAMVSKLDQSVGEVVAALRTRGMLENSIILFISDNGAPTTNFLSNHGSNYPLRGIKDTPWEGGIRGVATIWSPLIKKPKRVSNQMMYVADWLPTLLSAAGLRKTELRKIDGMDLWQAIAKNRISPRSEVLVNIDDISNYAAIRYGNFKYMTGDVGDNNEWLGESGEASEESGFPPAYDPNRVLQSKAGISIAGVITAQQVLESKRRKKSIDNEDTERRSNANMLTAQELLELRKRAVVKCDVREEDTIKCDPLQAPCLFDIVNDPCEMVNLAESRPQILALLERMLLKHRFNVVPPSNTEPDKLSDPSLYNGTWSNWGDIKKLKDSTHSFYNLRNKDISSTVYSGPFVAVMSIIFGVSIVGAVTLFTLKYGKQCKPANERKPKYEASLTTVTNINNTERYSTLIDESLKNSNVANGSIKTTD
ncbi:hypothetical protein KPH14_002156 [Odynerus spinipes]|uniref:Sulfatase N-terminal domain-containing protein n=1 Tax=Odynerus spinipes TaxID=1348599 RepID=A0AAD9VNY7_9HYME|nr:hypothetical protein KPH14_002156 [Odynerus spinipes]